MSGEMPLANQSSSPKMPSAARLGKNAKAIPRLRDRTLALRLHHSAKGQKGACVKKHWLRRVRNTRGANCQKKHGLHFSISYQEKSPPKPRPRRELSLPCPVGFPDAHALQRLKHLRTPHEMAKKAQTCMGAVKQLARRLKTGKCPTLCFRPLEPVLMREFPPRQCGAQHA